jgi:hypothetical protein
MSVFDAVEISGDDSIIVEIDNSLSHRIMSINIHGLNEEKLEILQHFMAANNIALCFIAETWKTLPGLLFWTPQAWRDWSAH